MDKYYLGLQKTSRQYFIRNDELIIILNTNARALNLKTKYIRIRDEVGKRQSFHIIIIRTIG